LIHFYKRFSFVNIATSNIFYKRAFYILTTIKPPLIACITAKGLLKMSGPAGPTGPGPGPLEVDGSVMEGGGQILRITGALSAILGIPIKIYKIRAGRASPGLKAQHLTGITLVRDITQGRLEGAKFASQEVTLYPGQMTGGEFYADTQNAGAVCLLAQIAVPCSLFAPQPTALNLKGGTNADMAPQVDEFTEVFLQNLKHFGPNVEFEVVRKGFYPRGGGEVNLFINPIHKLNPIHLVDPGKVVSITGWCFCAGSLPIKVAESIGRACKQELKNANSPALRQAKINIETYKEAANAANGNGSGIVLIAKTSTGCVLGGSALGSPKVSTEETGRKAALELLEAVECGGCVDKHIADQMVIFMALADGHSELRTGPLTLHTESAIHIAEALTKAKFSISNDPSNNSWVISCTGIGFTNRYL